MYAHRLHLAHLCLLCTLSAILLHSACLCDNVTLEKRFVKNASVYLITADLNDPSIAVTLSLAAKGIPHSESFQSMVKRSMPIAAVTGTYFDTRTLFPVGSIVVDGRAVHESAIGTAVCFVRPDRVECVNVAATDANVIQPRKYVVKFVATGKGERCDWSGVESGLRTGPRLLSNGQYALSPRREGFRHSGLFGERTRIALGHTPYNKLLLVAVRTPVTFGKLACIMKMLGATEAVALDGGTSSAMYYKGRIVCSPGRRLTNIIEIRQKPQINPPQDRMVKIINPIRYVWGKATQIGTAGGKSYASRRTPLETDFRVIAYSHFAILNAQIELGFAKSRHPFFPINRTKLASLKSLNHS